MVIVNKPELVVIDDSKVMQGNESLDGDLLPMVIIIASANILIPDMIEANMIGFEQTRSQHSFGREKPLCNQ